MKPFVHFLGFEYDKKKSADPLQFHLMQGWEKPCMLEIIRTIDVACGLFVD